MLNALHQIQCPFPWNSVTRFTSVPHSTSEHTLIILTYFTDTDLALRIFYQKKWYGHVWMPKMLMISWFLLTPPCRTKDSWILSIFSNDDIFLYAASDRAATPGSVLPVERKINRKLFPLLHLFTFLIAIEEFMSITICKLTSQSLSYVRRCDITIELIKKVPRHFSVSFYGSVKVQVFYIYHIQLMRTITWQLCKFLDFLVLLINLQQ